MAPETHTFHFSVGEATVTLQDISIIWALPIEGNLITGVDIKWTTQQWQNYCHQWLGFRPNENAFKRSRIKLSALLDWLLNNTCDDESPFDDVLQEARVCVMCIIGGILCPDATVITNMGMVTHNNTCPIPSNNAADLMPTVIDVENILPIPPYAARFLIILAQQTLLVIVPLTLVIGNMWMEQLVLDCDNSGDDIQSLRETRARNRAIGRDIMTFSSARYPSVRGGPAETRRHLGISPVPFDGSDLNTPIEEPQDIHPRRNRRRPRCGTGGHY
ncbi:UNVERIFIED_CONTAM: protein MAIN-LIKE 2 [Sesamum radiatum]|uniref:Protein MAIN-LIKE 2 n=1 Tax=Sesamum radiatum TaxID=300843 RepID=A0AAW2MYM1_SESRA